MSAVLDQFLKWQQTMAAALPPPEEKPRKKKKRDRDAPTEAKAVVVDAEPQKQKKKKHKKHDVTSSSPSHSAPVPATTSTDMTSSALTSCSISTAASETHTTTTTPSSSTTKSTTAQPRVNPYLDDGDDEDEEVAPRSLWLKPRGKQGKVLFSQAKKAESKKDDNVQKREPQRPWVGGAKPDKADGRKFLYGNYDRYYGYRNVEDFWVDARLPHFKAEWIHGKEVLDIGCNSGVMTILVAEKLGCRSIVGLDIDLGLVYAARENLSKRTRLLQMQALLKKNEQFHGASASTSTSSPADSATSAIPLSSSTPSSSSSTLSSEVFPDNVQFFRRDFMGDPLGSQTYDVVMCLSITKWIHYRSGDEGIKFLFEGIKQVLRPGGLLILEPQPWKNYRKKAHLTPEFLKNYKEIELKPEQFAAYLCDELGFKLMHTCYLEEEKADKKQKKEKVKKLETQPENPKTSFTLRPIYVLQRGEN